METDIVVKALQDIQAKIETISTVRDKSRTLYQPNEILNLTETKGFPCVGVVYLGMKGLPKANDQGMNTELTIDIYAVDKFICTSTDTATQPSLEVLGELRNAIKYTKFKCAGGNRLWEFVLEAPVDLGLDVLSYFQRWKTKLVLVK